MPSGSLDEGAFDVAFVADELYPFTAGGIGVLYGNLLTVYGEESRILFVNASSKINQQAFELAYPQARLVNAEDLVKNRITYPAEQFERTAAWHHKSYLMLECLLALHEAGTEWKTLEFQDFGGLAAATLLARPFHPFLQRTHIAIRAHGPEAVLRLHSARAPWRQLSVVMDLERIAYRDADTVIVHGTHHVQPLAQALDLPDLAQRVVLQRPPVGQCNGVLDHLRDRAPARQHPVAVFASKIDRIKTPELFVAGLARAQANNPRMGPGLILAKALPGDMSATGELIDYAEETGAVLDWRGDISPTDRLTLLGSTCVVIPGPFEAFCLLAYEVAILGGRPILSSLNPAFADETTWRDGKNCWKFDGTVTGLAAILNRAVREPLPDSLVWEHESIPYWRSQRQPGLHAVLERVRVAVIITNRDLEAYAGDCVASLLAQWRRPDEIVVVDDGSASTDVLESHLEDLQRAGIDVQLISNRTPAGLGAARNTAVKASTADVVVFLDIDDMLDPGFLERACFAFESEPALHVVVPFVACFVDRAEFLVGEAHHVLPFIGTSLFSRLGSNVMASATAAVRRSAFERMQFDERLQMYEDWDLWCQANEQDLRFAVDHRVGLWYRQRPGSMSARGKQSSAASLALDLVRTRTRLRGADALPGSTLTDLMNDRTHVAPADRQSAQRLVQAEAELTDLRQYQEDASATLARRSVRWGLFVAELRHIRRQRRNAVGPRS